MIKNELQLLLIKAKRPLSVPEILKEISANKTTIYRELEDFVSTGLITEVDFGDGKKRYEINSKNHHHHLICKNCGKIQDIKIDEKRLLETISSDGFLVERHNLEFFGICKKCQ